VFFTGSNKIVKHVLLTNFLIDENRKHEKRNKNKRGITKPDLIQKQRLLKEYQLTKYLTQERKKELARELNLSQVTVKVSSQP
jgi:hypothetical protein